MNFRKQEVKKLPLIVSTCICAMYMYISALCTCARACIRTWGLNFLRTQVVVA